MKTLLVVDDDFHHREITCCNLEMAGFLCESAGNGQDAFKLLSLRPIDLVLTDNQMPRMTGLELIRAINNEPAFRHIPTILFTGVPDLNLVLLAGSLGVYRTFFKPFNIEELVTAIYEVLSAEQSPPPKKSTKTEKDPASKEDQE